MIPTEGARIELVTVLLAETMDGTKVEHHYGRLFAANGEEVWRTSETYANAADVLRAIELLSVVLDAVTTDGNLLAITPVREGRS